MFNTPFTRYEMADAVALTARILEEEAPAWADGMSQYFYGEHEPSRYGSSFFDDIDRLESLQAVACFFLVLHSRAPSVAVQLAEDYSRVNDPAGVTIVLENSDDDPTMINAHISDPLAHAWVEKHGSFEGSTWEECDGPDFQYDTWTWHRDLIEDLRKDGLNLDLSQYSDPDERDIAIAAHAAECEDCQWNWHAAEEHYDALYPTWEVRERETGRVLFMGREEEAREILLKEYWRRDWIQIAPHTDFGNKVG